MKKIDKFRLINIIFSIFCIASAIFFGIYYAFIKYSLKRFVFALGALGLLILPYIIERVIKRRLGNVTMLLYNVFVYISVILGALALLGNYIPFFDKISHTLYGYLGCFIGLFIVIKSKAVKKQSQFFTVLICVLFSIASHALWEIWEFSFDSLLNFTMQGTKVNGIAPYVTDTMLDIVVNLLGALVFTLHYTIHIKTKKNLLIGSLKKEFGESDGEKNNS